VRDRLQELDLDALTPRDALEVLYDLKREAGSSEV
jgi:DNA mismatch repair protein MutS